MFAAASGHAAAHAVDVSHVEWKRSPAPAGERHQQHEGRRAHRWGKEDGYCVVDGQSADPQNAAAHA